MSALVPLTIHCFSAVLGFSTIWEAVRVVLWAGWCTGGSSACGGLGDLGSLLTSCRIWPLKFIRYHMGNLSDGVFMESDFSCLHACLMFLVYVAVNDVAVLVLPDESTVCI